MTSQSSSKLDLAFIRKRLTLSQGLDYWRSLEEVAQSEGFQELLHREFPRQAAEWNDPIGRRKFLTLMGASLALAGLTGCTRQPDEYIAPFVRQPEALVFGEPLFFATAMSLSGIVTGLLVESHEGRPTKVEGNPDHPASRGATDVLAQASVLTLYDPDRAQTVSHLGEIQSYAAFLGAIRSSLSIQRAVRGEGLRILTGAVTSPTLGYQLGEILKQMPEAKWHQYEPARGDGAREGALLAFGEPVNTIYHFDKADVVLSLDSDFLSCGPGHLRYSRDFTARRRLETTKNDMNRLYVVESTPTLTGSKADHRLPLPPSEIETFAWAVADQLGALSEPPARVPPHDRHGQWIAAVARDLQRHRGSSIVIAGEYQPAIVHAIAQAINHFLGNVGNTVIHTQPLEVQPVNQTASIRQLVEDMDAGKVEVLMILSSNPVYATPADLHFVESMARVKLRIHSSLYYDETSEFCHWHIPQAHYLESWSDGRAYDGTVSIVQPLIAPLYRGKTSHELLTALTDQPERSSYEILRGYWNTQHQTGDFEGFWRNLLHAGFLAGSAFQAKTVELKVSSYKRADAQSLNLTTPVPPISAPQVEVVFRPDPNIYDGEFANNGWLQELPKPLTKLTWDNAVLISPATAAGLGLSREIAWRGGEHGQVLTDVVELEYRGRRLAAPIWIMPGQADGCVTLHLGHGRKKAGHVGTHVGFSAYALRPLSEPWSGRGLIIRKTSKHHPIACTQYHHNMEGRNLLRSGTLDQYRKTPEFARGEFTDPLKTPSLYPGFEYKGYAWGMAIDLNSCTGCNACVVACQSENNIPVVGKEEVMHGREMHWLRVDLYYKGDLDNPETHFQPVPCQHCENAPCELVCPVQATNHSAEGLNNMIYNRCVGTRYCSNNCPYKVRRFNFFQYADWDTPSLTLLRNPEVTVRSRGIMEKCTYCVQRISHAKIRAEKEGRPVRDGEIVTACQAVCPAEAIVFGNINEPGSRVAKLKAEPRNYGLLEDLNTRPRTTYLAAVRNPNPELERA